MNPLLLTNPQRRALEFIRSDFEKYPQQGIMPQRLADLMWPNTRNRMSNVGHGAAAGVGGNLKAGQFLSSLCKKGLVYEVHHVGYSSYFLTLKGRNALEDL